MNPRDYYYSLVKLEGIPEYLKMSAPGSSITSEMIDQIALEMEIPLDAGTKEIFMKRYLLQRETVILNYLLEEILDVQDEDKKEQWKGRVFAGEYPIGTFNASCAPVPGGNGYVLLVNLGFIFFVTEITKIIFSQSQFAKFDRKGRPLTGSINGETDIDYDDAKRYYRSLVEDYVRYNFRWRKWFRRRVIIKGEAKNLLRAMLDKSILKFVLGHEFAHAILREMAKKTNYQDIGLLSIPRTKAKVPIIRNDPQDEINADIFSGSFLLAGLPRPINSRMEMASVNMDVAGPFVLFEIARAVENISRVNSDTHPPAETRARVLRVAFERPLPKVAFSLVDSFVGLLRTFEE